MTLVAPEAAVAERPQWRIVLTNPKVLAGIVMMVLFLGVIVAHPVLQNTLWEGQFTVYNPVSGFDREVVHPSDPSGEHWLGTDSLGRDVVSMFTYAARSTVAVALSSGVTIAALSLILGSVAAYRRGWLDGFVTHVSDAMVLLPALLAVFILGVGRPDDEFGALHVGIAFGIIYGLGPATATVRAAALTVMSKPFIDAARVAGGGGFWMVTRHVLPHLVQHAAVQAMIGVTGAVTAEAFLTYRSAVGDTVGFGFMIYQGLIWQERFAGIAATPWWVMIAGAAGITLLAGAFYLVGVGVREAFDPKTHTFRY